jgi:hypothetical protein
MKQEYEGWELDVRPAVKGLAIFLAGLLLLVIGSALLYNRHYAARTRPDPKPFPAPALEMIDSAPRDRRTASPTKLPAGIDRAMAETAARGDALWNE